MEHHSKRKKEFEPSRWKAIEAPSFQHPSKTSVMQPDEKLLHIINQIETKRIDLAPEYGDWRNIGFAFADHFGENGRELYHRISRFYPNYSLEETDLQYDRCMHSKGHGITMATFYYWVNQMGLNPKKARPKISVKSPESIDLPVFPEALYKNLPGILQEATRMGASNEERDMILLGSLATLSACFPNVYGIYDGKKVHCNLFLFVTANASAGKGKLTHCKHLVSAIHQNLREESKKQKEKYEEELKVFNKAKRTKKDLEKPIKPAEKLLFLPANTSTTGVFQLLSDNEGKGLIFETEGDTLANTFKSDYGNYSDGFRKAFHHESISYYRRMDREYVDIPSPQLSTVLSGTPEQVKSLIPNAENGLFSRFLFYALPMRIQWKDVFAVSENEGLDSHFLRLGQDFQEYYDKWEKVSQMKFQFTTEQRQHFNRFFDEMQQEYLHLNGIDYMATIRRLGLNAFRIAMLLSILKDMKSQTLPSNLMCDNREFQTALEIIRVLVKHAAHVYSEIQITNQTHRRKNRKERFLEKLPDSFSRQLYLMIAEELSIPAKTAERYVFELVKSGNLHHEAKDQYEKTDTSPG